MASCEVLVTRSTVREYLIATADWAEKLYMVAGTALAASPGPTLWLQAHLRKVAAIVAAPKVRPMDADLVGGLLQAGAIRVATASSEQTHTDLVLAVRGGQFRAVMGCVSLFGENPGPETELSTYLTGESQDEAFVQLMAWFRRMLRGARVPDRTMIPAVQGGMEHGDGDMGSSVESDPSEDDEGDDDEGDDDEGDDDEGDDDEGDDDEGDDDEGDDDEGDDDEGDDDDSTPFLSRSLDGRVDIVWQMLIGKGRIKRDAAIRAAAREMRDADLVAFNRLRADGELYAAVGQAIRQGLEDGCFEERGRGYVLAVAEDLDSDDWAACLCHALRYGPILPSELPAACADAAEKLFGLKFKRLRSGGRIMTSIREALAFEQKEGRIRFTRDGMLEWTTG